MLNIDRVRSGILLILSLILLLGSGLPAVARADTGYVREVRILETGNLGLAHPAGLAFSPEDNVFIVVEAASATQPKLVAITPYEERVGSASLDISVYDLINVTFDSRFNRLLLLETPSQLRAMGVDAGGRPQPSGAAAAKISIGQLGLQDPQGLTVDPASGDLLVLDRSALRIVRVRPDSQANLGGAPASNPQGISWIDLKHTGLKDPRSLALNPGNGHLYTLNPSQQKLYELDQAGQVVAAFDLAQFGFAEPQGLVFAPSGDPTDSPSNLNLYVADASPASGRIVELSFTPAAAPLADVPTVAASLERVTQTSLFSPPSPDPAGIAYITHSNTLMISDSEVDEMPRYFAGSNVFETSLSGGLLRTFGTTAFSNEPTGVAYDPVSRHLWFSDDNAHRIHELDPGPDGLYGTPDDTRTPFNTSAFGSQDPEGITFDTWRGHLFVMDGLGAEAYDISPGTDGLFDGLPPAGDDSVTQFDVSVLGILDPEGVEFNPDNGHLYIMANGTTDLIAETSTTGWLFRYISLSSFDPWAPAGLAYAPSSTNPAQRHLYIIDRTVDNNVDPNENDGKLYEVSFPPFVPSPNQPPAVSAGPDQTIAFPANAVLDGTVADDGLPSPPALTTAWSQVNGPGIVTFANASAVDTTASFPATGVYRLKLTASDGEFTANDRVTITVLPSNQAPVVNAGTDQVISLLASVSLHGTVTDDGLPNPPGTVSTTWSQVSGPGTVTFANASAVVTTASFSTEGSYVLRLTASDGQLSNSDEVSIFVQAKGQVFVYLPLVMWTGP